MMTRRRAVLWWTLVGLEFALLGPLYFGFGTPLWEPLQRMVGQAVALVALAGLYWE